MNRQRRKSIQELIDQMEELKSELESLQEEEQEAYDNLPESFQEGERGEQMQEAIENLESAVSSLEEAIDYATSAIEKDEWRGKPIRYLLWQKAALSAIYGVVERGSDRRKFQKVFIEVGKKNGKTTMIAPVALYETAKKGNEVYSAANALQQSKIIWTEAANMLDQSPDLKAMLKRRQYDIKNIRPNGFSVFMALANQPDMLDGKLPKVVILDEVHELEQDIYDILYNGQIGCADPLFIMLSTNGYKRGALFDTEHENSKAILDGLIQDERKFSLLYELNDPKDWLNEAHWQQVNPSLGTVFPIERLRSIVQDALAKPKSLNAVKTKHFNLGPHARASLFY